VAAALGTDAAYAAGFAKELLDAQGPSGFSFADIAADRAGARFGNGVLKGNFPVAGLAAGFAVESFMPPVEGLPEKLSTAQFKAQFGSKSNPKTLKQLQEIDRRINALPPYRPSTFQFTP
jgi:hypothetical protein